MDGKIDDLWNYISIDIHFREKKYYEEDINLYNNLF